MSTINPTIEDVEGGLQAVVRGPVRTKLSEVMLDIDYLHELISGEVADPELQATYGQYDEENT